MPKSSFISIIFLFLAFIVKSQEIIPKPVLPIDPETKQISYDGIISVDGTNKDELLARALKWCYEYFKNPTQVIQEIDSTNGKILCKHKYMVYDTVKGKAYLAKTVRYWATFYLKDGKYKYVINNMRYESSKLVGIEEWLDENDPDKEKQFKYLFQTDAYVKSLLDNLEKAMKTKELEKNEFDW